MNTKIKLLVICLVLFIGFSASTFAQDASTSTVVIKMTYEDENGKKHTETKKLSGAEADAFDAEAYEANLKERNIKILNLDISKEANMSGKGELHEEHDVKIMKSKGAGKSKKMVKTIIIEKDGDDQDEEKTYEIKGKDGKFFVNDEKVKGKHKETKIIKSGDDEQEVNVEVKNGKVFINGEEVEESEMDGDKHVIIKKTIDGDGQENIWISDDNELFEMDGEEGEMIFISSDDDTPRMGIMIEDGKDVNGATVVDAIPDSPASKAGLKKGDTVTAIDDVKVYGASSLMSAMEEKEAGDEVKVTYVRDGKTMTSAIKLERMADEMHKEIEKKIIIKREKKQ